MKFSGWFVVLYGILVSIGGIIGFVTKGSMGSLVMGSLCGILLLISGWGILQSKRLAFVAALVISGFLAAFFGYRYYLTGNLMPGGGMGVLSALVFLLLLTTKKSKILSKQR